MEKSPALVLYEGQTADLRRRFRAGKITRDDYRNQKAEVLRRALPKLKIAELAELDRQAFDLLAEQKRGHA